MQLFKIKHMSRIWNMKSLPSESIRQSHSKHRKSLSQKEALERHFCALGLERWHIDADWQMLAQTFPYNPSEKTSSPWLAACSASQRVLQTHLSKSHCPNPIPCECGQQWVTSTPLFANGDVGITSLPSCLFCRPSYPSPSVLFHG